MHILLPLWLRGLFIISVIWIIGFSLLSIKWIIGWTFLSDEPVQTTTIVTPEPIAKPAITDSSNITCWADDIDLPISWVQFNGQGNNVRMTYHDQRMDWHYTIWFIKGEDSDNFHWFQAEFPQLEFTDVRSLKGIVGVSLTDEQKQTIRNMSGTEKPMYCHSDEEIEANIDEYILEER